MHEVVFYAAALWMTLLFGVSVALVVRARSLLGRILALDLVILILIALLVLLTGASRVAYYLDAALVLALVAVVTTIAAARYATGERPLP